MATAAHTLLPVDVPLSPPPYEEAIRTTAPDVSISMDTVGNDEPPPSYSEATKDEVHPPVGSDQLNTSDLMELIFPVPSSIEQSRRGRRSLDHCSSRRRADAGDVSNHRIPNQSRDRRKLSMCLLSAGMGVFLVAGLIAASILRHRPKMSGHKTHDLAYVTVSPINQEVPQKIWMDMSKNYEPPHDRIINIRKQHQRIFDALRKSLSEAQNERSFFFPINRKKEAKSTVDPFYEEIRKISEKNSLSTSPPDTK